MRIFLLHVLLALTWVVLTGIYSAGNLLCGFLAALLVIGLIYPGKQEYLARIMGIPGFLFFFLWELFKANLRVAGDIVTLKHRMKPAVVPIPLDLESELAITVFAMLLTLTPGTLSLDLSRDSRTLFVHAMYVDDREEFIRTTKEGLERRVGRVFQ